MPKANWIARAAAWLLAAALVMPCRGDDAPTDTYDVLSIGLVSYTNVVVQTKTKTDLFFKHANGFANVKVKDLDRSTQLKLGYLVEDAAHADGESAFAAPKIEIDPRVEELQEQIIWELQEALAKVSPKIIHGCLGAVFLGYLLFCNFCRLICRKTFFAPGPVGLVWFPLLKQIPLLKAAGLKPWLVLLNLVPPLFLILYLVWCFKIVKARGRHAVVAWLLLLPVTNVFAFLYLAMADGVNEPEEDERTKRGIITLYQDKPRHVA